MQFKDRTGERYGALTVIGRAPSIKSRVRWSCRCDCGSTKTVSGNDLGSGNTTSCGCGLHRSKLRAVDLTGQRFGLLIAVERVRSRDHQDGIWLCRCDCGGERRTGVHLLTSGKTTNCGCKRRTHGHSYGSNGRKSPTYLSWSNMLARCTNPTNPAYDHYKKLGIVVWDGWRSFERFLADMGDRPEGTTLDRIDNDGNYEPGNCRWATKTRQANNRRTNLRLEYKGNAYSLADLARATGQSKETLRVRLVRPGGWSVAEAVETPTIPRHMRRAKR